MDQQPPHDDLSVTRYARLLIADWLDALAASISGLAGKLRGGAL